MAHSCYAPARFSYRALADTSLFIHFHPQLFHICQSAESLAWQAFLAKGLSVNFFPLREMSASH